MNEDNGNLKWKQKEKENKLNDVKTQWEENNTTKGARRTKKKDKAH